MHVGFESSARWRGVARQDSLLCATLVKLRHEALILPARLLIVELRRAGSNMPRSQEVPGGIKVAFSLHSTARKSEQRSDTAAGLFTQRTARFSLPNRLDEGTRSQTPLLLSIIGGESSGGHALVGSLVSLPAALVGAGQPEARLLDCRERRR